MMTKKSTQHLSIQSLEKINRVQHSSRFACYNPIKMISYNVSELEDEQKKSTRVKEKNNCQPAVGSQPLPTLSKNQKECSTTTQSINGFHISPGDNQLTYQTINQLKAFLFLTLVRNGCCCKLLKYRFHSDFTSSAITPTQLCRPPRSSSTHNQFLLIRSSIVLLLHSLRSRSLPLSLSFRAN